MTIYKAHAEASYVRNGFYHALVEIDGRSEMLMDKRGNRRTFSTRATAMAAAEKEITARLKAEADVFNRRPLPVPHVADRLLSGVTMPRNPLTIWRQPRG